MTLQPQTVVATADSAVKAPALSRATNSAQSFQAVYYLDLDLNFSRNMLIKAA